MFLKFEKTRPDGCCCQVVAWPATASCAQSDAAGMMVMVMIIMVMVVAFQLLEYQWRWREGKLTPPSLPPYSMFMTEVTSMPLTATYCQRLPLTATDCH